MSKYLRGDLALSVTYVPGTRSTFAVIYGCDEHQKQEVEKRIRLAEDKTKYPLLIIGIFAELERERLVDTADQLVDGFALTSERFENESWDPEIHMSNEKTQEYLKLCSQSRSITDQIRAVKRQTLKLMSEIDEFGDYFATHKGDAYSGSSKKVRQFRKAGAQMKKRLQDIINEYDDKIDECNMIVGNTTLAMQTVSPPPPPNSQVPCLELRWFMTRLLNINELGVEPNRETRLGTEYSHRTNEYDSVAGGQERRHTDETNRTVNDGLPPLFKRCGKYLSTS